MTTATGTYALLAQDSYKDHKLGQIVSIAGVNYKVLDQANHPASGYQGIAYQRVGTNDIVIAHRGTEQIVRDGVLTDGAMVLIGVNLQTPDAMDFAQRVLAKAKVDAEANHRPLEVTVTGHSLGGTLAEITASRFGLHGETFNAYGAAGLLQGVPVGGNQVIDHVRATDVVSAGSAHFGEVHIYAAQQDIDRLNSAGYRDDGGILSLRNPLEGIDLGAHGIDSFVPDSKTLGHSIVSAESEARYRAHHGMIDRYRSDVMELRTGLSTKWEISKLVAESGVALGRAAAHEGAQGVDAADHAAHQLAREAVQGAHALEQGARSVGHAVEHAVGNLAHSVHEDMSEAAHTAEHVVSHGVLAASHTVSQGVHVVEHAAQPLAGDASRAFDLLRHPGSCPDNQPKPAAPPVRLDHPAHPDHPLYRQTRDAVHRLDIGHHRTSDPHSDNLAASLVVAARRDGMKTVDHVVLSNDATRTFAVQGALDSPFKQIAQVETAQASNTTIEQSTAAWQRVMQRQPDSAQLSQMTQEQQTQQKLHSTMGT